MRIEKEVEPFKMCSSLDPYVCVCGGGGEGACVCMYLSSHAHLQQGTSIQHPKYDKCFVKVDGS